MGSNVLLDVISHDEVWASWSERALRPAAKHSTLAINPIIFAEVSVKFARLEDADAALADFRREPLPYEAGYLSGKAFLSYRRRGGIKRSLMLGFSHLPHARAAVAIARGAACSSRFRGCILSPRWPPPRGAQAPITVQC